MPPSDATGGALVVQPHGGAIRPWRKGESGNPGGASNVTREAIKLAKAASPRALGLLVAIMDDPAADTRARIVAAVHVLDRALGRAKDAPRPDHDTGPRDDLTVLTTAERAELAEALAAVRRLRAVAAERGGSGTEARSAG